MSHRGIHHSWRHLGAIAVAWSSLLLTSTSASAETRQSKERTARKACLNGDYVQGVSILSDLFIDTKDPTYIFNQGRCLEQSRRYEDAIARFEEYLRTDVNLKGRDLGEKHLADCKAKLAETRENDKPLVAPPPMSAPTFPSHALSSEPAAKESSTPVVEATRPSEPAQPRWGLITAGIVTASVGVGGAVAGLLFNFKANNLVSDWEKNPSYSSSNSDKQKTYKTIAWVGYGAGAALAATGAILIAVGASSHSSSTNDVALAPSVGPGQVGAMLTGAF